MPLAEANDIHYCRCRRRREMRHFATPFHYYCHYFRRPPLLPLLFAEKDPPFFIIIFAMADIFRHRRFSCHCRHYAIIFIIITYYLCHAIFTMRRALLRDRRCAILSRLPLCDVVHHAFHIIIIDIIFHVHIDAAMMPLFTMPTLYFHYRHYYAIYWFSPLLFSLPLFSLFHYAMPLQWRCVAGVRISQTNP
jgi:hypothetical protein